MFLPFYATLATAILFYFVLPLLSAMSARLSWLHFRRRLEALSKTPILGYRDAAGSPEAGEVHPRLFRLYGRIEAVEGADRVWLRGESVSALVDLSSASLYVLGRGGDGEAAWAPERAGSVEKLSWKRVRVLSEGTKLFVAGPLIFEEGRPIFHDMPNEPLLAILYDGGEDDLLSRIEAGGRRRNEYWNSITPAFLACGLGLSSVLIFLLARGNTLPTVRALSFLVAMAPLLPFLPPGLVFFFLYRLLWRQALALRIAKDIYRLPLRYFDGPDASEGKLPNGGIYRRAIPDALEAKHTIPTGHRVIAPPPGYGELARRVWTLFSPEGSLDPAAERVAIQGEPEFLADRCERHSYVLALSSGIALLASVVSGYAVAFAIWRTFLAN